MITLNYQLQRFHDLDLLQHFLIVHKLSGVCLFYHPFKKLEIQFDLISGFISAMSSMYAEFTGEGMEGSVESLKYQGMILNGFSGNHTMGILIADGKISTSFSLNKFIASFESRYDYLLKDWSGVMNRFEPEWIVKHLYDEIGYFNNLPFLVSTKKPKKLYSKPMVFLQSRCNSHGKFMIRKVLPSMKTFLDISEANTFDVLMMLKLEDLISHTPLTDILEPTVKAGSLLETFSSDVGAEKNIYDSPADSDEQSDKVDAEDVERIETNEDAFESLTSDVIVTAYDDGIYTLEKEVSLRDLIQHSGDAWLRDVATEAITSYLGRKVVVSCPQYTPVVCDSDRGTFTIRITCSLEE